MAKEAAKTKGKKKKSGVGSSDAQTNGADANERSADSPGMPEFSHVDEEELLKINKAMNLLQLRSEENKKASVKTQEEAAKKTFEFWNTQPVPKIDEEITSNEAISQDIALEKLRRDPYSLPPGFQWSTLNLDDPLVLKELYVLLNENYVEDDDNMFRFDYSPEFLYWALQPPGKKQEWHCGVRSTRNGKLLAFISAIPASIQVYDKKKEMVEINFLCVHKKLRSKRIAPVLIREITRRVNCNGIFQAVYTAGVVLPKPVSTCRYWHRSLNPKKLIEVKFSHLSRNMTMQRHLKLYRLPEEVKTMGLRRLKKEDIPATRKLLNDYLSKFSLRPSFTDEEFCHWFLPREDIVECYIVESEGEITDMFSFYSLPSTVMKHPTHKTLRAAYSFYNVSTKTSWTDLIGDALIIAKKNGYDVFNALDLMENSEFLEKLKFGIGDGNLQYYLYNWRCPSMTPKDIALVLQ